MSSQQGIRQVEPLTIISDLVDTVEAVREILEANRPEQLEEAVGRFEDIQRKINDFPGGPAAIAAELERLPQEKNLEYRNLLERTKLQHETNQSLIKLAIQRNAALQSYSAQSNLSATYSSEGGVPLSSIGKLLGKT